VLQEARILANFKHFCDVEFASGKCPHLAIRDRSNLRGGRGRNIIVALLRKWGKLCWCRNQSDAVAEALEDGEAVTFKPL
jgi:hypothetical protein